jgi:CRP-like cAMP-binding protein
MLDINERKKALSLHPFFSLLTEMDLMHLAELMYESTFHQGETIVREGDLVDSVYIIVNGTAEVTRQSLTVEISGEIIIAKLHVGESIGLMETGFFTHTGLRTASVTALTDMTLLGIGLNELNHFMHESKRLYFDFRNNIKTFLKLNLIKHLEPFSSLSHDMVLYLLKNIKTVEVNKNTYLFKQGDEADNCYLLESGQIQIFQNEKLITVLEPPNIFGETAILTKSKRNASAYAENPATLLTLSADILMNLAKKEKKLESSFSHLINTRSKIVSIKKTELIISKPAADGSPRFMLKNPVTKKYQQLSLEEKSIYETLKEGDTIGTILNRLQRNKAMDSAFIEKFIFYLVQNNFIVLNVLSFDLERPRESFWQTIIKKMTRWIKM